MEGSTVLVPRIPLQDEEQGAKVTAGKTFNLTSLIIFCFELRTQIQAILPYYAPIGPLQGAGETQVVEEEQRVGNKGLQKLNSTWSRLFKFTAFVILILLSLSVLITLGDLRSLKMYINVLKITVIFMISF